MSFAEVTETSKARSGQFEIVEDAIRRCEVDAGALFDQRVIEALVEMRSTQSQDYQRLRSRIKGKVSITELEKLMSASSRLASSASARVMFTETEPYTERVEGEILLDEIGDRIGKYVVADIATLRAATLWAVHTWLMDIWTVSPLAHITAPEKRCGKTVLLRALANLVKNPLSTSNISAATLYRSIAKWSPTLLIDEVDSFLTDNDTLRGIINAGLYRDDAVVLRCAVDSHEPMIFPVWAAKAVCGIGNIQSTIADRSIVLRLKRKTSDEQIDQIRHSDQSEWALLRSKIARWVSDNKLRIAAVRPEAIPELNDRANDCWEPLLAIAEIAGGAWLGYARDSALSTHVSDSQQPTVNIELLGDIYKIFQRRNVVRIFSSDLLVDLTRSIPDSPWATIDRGRPLSAHKFKSIVSEFGVFSKPIRIGDAGGKHGYERKWFNDVFARYVPESVDANQTVKQVAQEELKTFPDNSSVCSTEPVITRKSTGERLRLTV